MGNKAIDTAYGSEFAAYTDWLKEKRLTSDKQIRYFASWVQRFLRFRHGCSSVKSSTSQMQRL